MRCNSKNYIIITIMTLARLAERIQEEKDKQGKLDGRRFNSRSKTKMNWEINNLKKNMEYRRRWRNTRGPRHKIFTQEELEECEKQKRQMKKKNREKPRIDHSCEPPLKKARLDGPTINLI